MPKTKIWMLWNLYRYDCFDAVNLRHDEWKYTKQFNSKQVRVTDLVQDKGNTAQKLVQEQSFSITRPDIPLISTSDRIPLAGIVESDPGSIPDVTESDDGVKYCRLDVDTEIDEEMLDSSMKNWGSQDYLLLNSSMKQRRLLNYVKIPDCFWVYEQNQLLYWFSGLQNQLLFKGCGVTHLAISSILVCEFKNRSKSLVRVHTKEPCVVHRQSNEIQYTK